MNVLSNVALFGSVFFGGWVLIVVLVFTLFKKHLPIRARQYVENVGVIGVLFTSKAFWLFALCQVVWWSV